VQRSIRYNIAAIATALIWGAGNSPSSAQQQPHPNILVIMADDIGYWNISAYNRGQMGYRTPNIVSPGRHYDNASQTDHIWH
jgi:arylsulfatase